MTRNRKDILLRAAYDLLKRASEDHYVRSATEITTYYDEAECDGYRLMEDIAMELGIETSEEPLRRDHAQLPDDDITAYKRRADAEGTR